jgi:N-acetylglutamate synthase-like GNAT family acetyltransferase
MFDLTARIAELKDADTIASLVNAAFSVERFFIEGERTNPDQVRALLQTGDFLLAEAEGSLIACVYVERRGESGYFGLLAVDPTRQGQGLGARLVAAAEDHCRAAGCRVMELQIVNLRAELPAFYRARGYSETGTAPFPGDSRAKLPCHFVKMAKPL